MHRLVSHLVAFLYPHACVGCRKRVYTSHSLCQQCWSKLDFIGEPLAIYYDEANDYIGGDLYYDSLQSVVQFGDLARDLIHDFKYKDKTYLEIMLAKLMVLKLAQVGYKADIIVPVPLHRKKLRNRQYNQAALLALRISKLTKVRCVVDGVCKVQNTPSQTALDYHDRIINNRDAFRINAKHKALFKQQKVLLIDDVVTTGATVNECSKVIKAAGARSVIVLTFAKN